MGDLSKLRLHVLLIYAVSTVKPLYVGDALIMVALIKLCYRPDMQCELHGDVGGRSKLYFPSYLWLCVESPDR